MLIGRIAFFWWLFQVVHQVDMDISIFGNRAKLVYKSLLTVVVVFSLHALHERVDKNVRDAKLFGAVLHHPQNSFSVSRSGLIVQP